jgi:hypothetical protein
MKTQSIFENDFYLDHKIEILDFCKQAFEEKSQPSHVNMWHDNWENVKVTLPYILYKTDRFANDNGDMFVLLNDDNKILGMSGINVSDFDANVALGGVRTWLDIDFRGKFVIGKYFLPTQLKWAKEHNMKAMALTFNDYNKKLINNFKRSGFGIKKQRTVDSMFYNGHFYVDFPVIINHTKQWVVYHKIDEAYEPNWESIRFIEKERIRSFKINI